MFKPVLEFDDGPVVRVLNESGKGNVVLVCEHASHRVPDRFANVLASESVLLSHAGWDPGAMGIARHLSALLDAPLVVSAFSRLVYDVNRPPTSPDAMRTRSETYDIPGNAALTPEEYRERIAVFYEPFHDTLDALLTARTADNRSHALVTIHTFSPIWFGQHRDVELGILHDEDTRLADELLVAAPAATNLRVARNQPYGPDDGVTHTLQRHATARKLHNVMLEVRNDLVESAAQQRDIAGVLENLLQTALKKLGFFAPLARVEL